MGKNGWPSAARQFAARAFQVPADRVPSAPIAARLYAYAVDWAVGGIVTGVPGVLAYAAITRRQDMFPNLYVFEALGYPWAVGIACGVACLVAGLLYYAVIPWRVWPGQTLGKHLMKIQVARADGDAVALGLGRLLARYGLAGFCLEGSAFVAGRYLREIAVLITRVDVNYYWEIAGMVLTALSAVMALALPHRRALHDYLTGTRVVPAPGHPLYKGGESDRLDDE